MQGSIKKNLLNEALKIISSDGWCPDLLKKASKSMNMDEAAGGIIFPGDLSDLLKYYIESIDFMMLERYKNNVLKDMKAHQRVRLCILLRLEILSLNKKAAAKTLAFLLMPANQNVALKALSNTIDLIWYEAGNDQSTDFNYYTKRAILGSVYSATILYWISDDSKDFVQTINFLDRRLAEVYEIYKIKSKLVNFFNL